MKKCLTLLALTATALPILHAAPADYLGATAVLEKAAEQSAASAPASEQNTLKARLNAFGREAASLDPTTAATKWLAFLDEISKSEQSYDSRVGFSDLVKALPPPPAWKALRENAIPAKTAADKVPVPRLLVAWYADRLLGDDAGLKADYDRLATLPHADVPTSDDYDQFNFLNLAPYTEAVLTDRKVRTAFLRKRIELMLDITKKMVKAGSTSDAEFSFPDAALIADEETARELITLVLTTCPAPVEFPSDTQTLKLATQIALERIDSLAAPQWGLTCSMDGGPLYAAMVKRFGTAPVAGSRYSSLQPRMFAFYRALAQDNADAAGDIASKIGTSFDPDSYTLSSLADAGHGATICEVLHRVLASRNKADLWHTYILIATRTGRTQPMMELLESALSKAGDDTKLRRTLDAARISAFLATDKADEAVALITKDIDAPATVRTTDEALGKALELAGIGKALDRKDWFEQGIDASQRLLKELLASRKELRTTENFASILCDLLIGAGRGPEAESLLGDLLAACIAAQKNPGDGYEATDVARDALCDLVGVYAAAGRAGDILTLAKESKNWNASDLAAIFHESCPMGPGKSEPLAVVIARALNTTGNRDEAIRIIEATLPFLSGDDSAYQLLVDLLGQEAMPILDRIAAGDAFEERPLIWKAKLLLDAKKLDEAESVARKAISIDPSDGEEGKGDRMRVYAVLADILAAKGNTKDAETFRNVVASIRMSEDADDLYHLGLLKRAIALYEKSLLRFADAYCIQSRLALRLVESGDWKAAEEHYRRAYELMPDSFGRVESHCFGCERAFAGQVQQSIAEKVFQKLAKEQPDKPQVHYLLGYLYEEQGRTADAIPEFRKAVELDPDYLNAWKKLSAAPAAALTPAEHGRVAANLIRLDPAGRHRSLQLESADNLAEIWTLLDAAKKSVPHQPDKLQPLPASARIQDQITIAAQSNARITQLLESNGSERNDDDPGEIFSNQDFSQSIDSWLSNLQSSSAE